MIGRKCTGVWAAGRAEGQLWLRKGRCRRRRGRSLSLYAAARTTISWHVLILILGNRGGNPETAVKLAVYIRPPPTK